VCAVVLTTLSPSAQNDACAAPIHEAFGCTLRDARINFANKFA
jgi:hypothetical protein